MTTRSYLFDGVKSSLLWDEETDAWSYSSGGPETAGAKLYRTIPTLYRGIRIISDSIQKIPFAVYRGETEFDVSETWENKVEVFPNPRRTFSLLSESLDKFGKAYLLKVRNRGRYTKELKWLAASTIEPVLDQASGLVGFKRSLGNQVIDLPVEDVIYFWLPDADVEVGPPLAYPVKAGLAAAGVLNNLNAYMSGYFERGAIRPLIVTAKNMPSRDERERMETWLNKLLGGIKNAFRWRIFNADALDFKTIGDGLDQLQNQSLTADQRQDVSLALGIPQTILFANSANFATSQSDQRNFYDMTVVPRAEFIASVLNEQLLLPLGYRLQFQPDEMDMYQEDEASRASSLGALVNAGVPLLLAMDLLGFELSDDQRAELEELEAEPEPEPTPPQLQPAQPMQDQQLPAETQPAVMSVKGDAPGHPFRGNQWTDGEGGGFSRMREWKPARDAARSPSGRAADWSPKDGGMLFHGTSAPNGIDYLEANDEGVVYLTDDFDEATGYAAGVHLGGAAGGDERVYYQDAVPGALVDANAAVEEALMNGGDLKEVWDAARASGADYAYYTHPSSVSGKQTDQNVIVALNPGDQLGPAKQGWNLATNSKIGYKRIPRIDPEVLAEEKRWKRACLQAHRKSKDLPLDWISDAIPPQRFSAIVSRLADADSAETISAAFQNSATEYWTETPEPDFKTGILEELKRANDLLEGALGRNREDSPQGD